MKQHTHGNHTLTILDFHTPLDTFVCADCVGKTELEEFLREQALALQNEQIARTVVATYEGRVVGYVTYGLDALTLEYPDAQDAGVDSYIGSITPVLRIHRLAVAKDWSGKGIGTQLVQSVLQALKQLRSIVPCPNMIVDAYEDAVGFYEKCGFREASSRSQWRKRTPSELLMFAAFPPEITASGEQAVGR